MSLRENLICLWTLFSKESYRFLRIWGQTLVPPVMTSSLYFLIFGSFIGNRINGVSGYSLMEFMTPGLVMMAVVSSAYMNVSSSFYFSKFQRNIDELLIAPCSNHVIIFGYALAGVFRSVIVGILIFITASSFTNLGIKHVASFISFLFLTAFLFSLIGLINGIFAKKFDDISVIPTFVLTPLSYLGGIFYSIDQIPESWALVTRLNPIFYLINGLRYSVLEFSDVKDTNFSALFLCGLILGVYLLCYILLRKGIGIKS